MVYKSNKSTKDGRRYFFRVKYKDIYGKTVDYTSSKFLTKKEAEIISFSLYYYNISLIFY